MYDSIIDALRRHAGDEALAAAQALVQQAPHDPQAHRWLAAALQLNGQLDAALESIDQAISLAPEEADLYVARASLQLSARQPESASASLAQASQLDPNQFQAYLLQAHLALARGDVEEAERVLRLAERVAPDHPLLAGVQSMVRLRRGDHEGAQKLIAYAIEALPEDAQLRHQQALVYMESGHLAFAEQAMRRAVEINPQIAPRARGLLAELIRRQGRPDDALEELAPLLADSATRTPGLESYAGRLHLTAGRVDAAMPLLLAALAAAPDHRDTLSALLMVWQRTDQQDTGRNTLDAALATRTDAPALWLARLSLEEVGSPQALELANRWAAAMPDSSQALEARMAALGHAGQHDAAEAVARELIARSPGHIGAQTTVVNVLLARDPVAAVGYIESLLEQARTEQSRQLLTGWLGMAQDKAGRPQQAVASWTARAEQLAPQSLPLHRVSLPQAGWPAEGEAGADVAHPIFLWGAPGSGVERMASVFAATAAAFRGDRFGPQAPRDGLQQFSSVEALEKGEMDVAAMIEDWRAGLLRRGIRDGNVIEWLVWWDNALLNALRPQVPGGLLMVALRDPRDMLLEWLAFGAPSYMAIPSPLMAAQWLAAVLDQLATLHEQDLYRHALIRLDGIENNPQAISASMGGALGGLALPAPAAVGPVYFEAGHWRQYAHALAEPFALLAPVAARLGYPQA